MMNPSPHLQAAASSEGNGVRAFRAASLWPHEWLFGGFLLVQWLRLVRAVGPLDPDAGLYLLLLAANAAIIGRCEWRETRAWWHARLWFYPVAMNVIFFTMSSAVPKVDPRRWDPALRGIDEFLFGAPLSERVQGLASPLLTEVLSGCYLLFFPYLVITGIDYARRGLGMLRPLFVGLFSIYGLGFLGYALVPAAGPHLASPEVFTAPLTGWAVTALNARVVAGGSNGVDVFPSLHCAVAGFLLGFDRRHSPRRFRLLGLPCAGLGLATVYLRYHYLVDVLGGLLLAALGGWLAQAALASRPPDLAEPARS